MNIPGGVSVEVYRNADSRDRHGDKSIPPLVGTIDHCVFQWASAASVGLRYHAANDFREGSDLNAVLFAPRDNPLQIQPRDRLKFGGHWFQVVGDRAWDELNPATGYNFGYYMVQVETVT